MRYLSAAALALREVPSGWAMIFGRVPHARWWLGAYWFFGIGAAAMLGLASSGPNGYRARYLVAVLPFAAVAAGILAALRWLACRHGRAHYEIPHATLDDIIRHATEDRANRLAQVLAGRGTDVRQVAQWIDEHFRIVGAARIKVPQWLLNVLFLPLPALITLAVNRLGWAGALFALTGASMVLAMWLLGTAWQGMAHDQMNTLNHLVRLALIRNGYSTETSPSPRPIHAPNTLESRA